MRLLLISYLFFFIDEPKLIFLNKENQHFNSLFTNVRFCVTNGSFFYMKTPFLMTNKFKKERLK